MYICYAPSDNPEIAISVVIEYGASGSNSIAVAGEVLRAYYGDTGLGEGLPARKDGLGFGDGLEISNLSYKDKVEESSRTNRHTTRHAQYASIIAIQTIFGLSS